MNIVCKIFIFLSFLLCSSCGYSNTNSDMIEGLPIATDTVSFDVLGKLKSGVILIDDTIDLKNKACLLPPNITLRFKEGCIQNGTLIGNITKIKTSKACFNRVKIEGTWNVPVIKSSLFYDLTYDNALKDVVALANPGVKNKIIIERGNYQVTAYRNGDVCIPVCSNTEIIINGIVKLTPNDFKNYYIIQAEGQNITIKGRGTIVGDKHTHTGNKGEWGMGIELAHAHHVLIKDLTIKDCWGDCIYVGSESSNVTIENCSLVQGRRQGISITSADGVLITDCTIKNVAGTAPQYALDIEPNANQTVSNVTVKNVRAMNCVGGFLIWGKAKNAKVKNVYFSNCYSTGTTKKYPMLLMGAENVVIENCHVDSNSDFSALTQEIISLKVKNNFFSAKGNRPLNVLLCNNVEINNNKILFQK